MFIIRPVWTFSKFMNQLATDSIRTCYAATRKNMKIDKNTKVICQGITGKTGTIYGMDALSYGTRLVGGVWRGKGGKTHLKLPVFDTVKDAKKNTGAEATIICLPPHMATEAIFEAIDAEMPLIVCVANGISLRDMVHIRLKLVNQSKSRLLGPSSIGILVPGECKLGMMPANVHKKGNIAIISRCGTLMYEAASQITQIGLGQTLCVGIGCHTFTGTDFVDCLDVSLKDPETKGIVLIGRSGGTFEEEAAEFLTKNQTIAEKPVISYIADKSIQQDHTQSSSNVTRPGRMGNTWKEKIQALKNAGSVIAWNPTQIGNVLLAEIKRKEDNLSESEIYTEARNAIKLSS